MHGDQQEGTLTLSWAQRYISAPHLGMGISKAHAEKLKLCSYMQNGVHQELRLCSYMQTCIQEERQLCTYVQTCVQ